jgi:hypothetical protein
MKAEEEISGINCDIADFVSQMSLDPAEEVVICVNGSQEMKKAKPQWQVSFGFKGIG